MNAIPSSLFGSHHLCHESKQKSIWNCVLDVRCDICLPSFSYMMRLVTDFNSIDESKLSLLSLITITAILQINYFILCIKFKLFSD